MNATYLKSTVICMLVCAAVTAQAQNMKRPSLREGSKTVQNETQPTRVSKEDSVTVVDNTPASSNNNSNQTPTRPVTGDNVIAADEFTIPLRTESVNVSKQTRSDGSVRLRKYVTTETVNTPMEVRRETLVLERVSDNRARQLETLPATFEEGEILLPISREEVVINKVVKTDYVLARVEVATDKQNVQETIRTERIDMDRSNDRIRVNGDLNVAKN